MNRGSRFTVAAIACFGCSRSNGTGPEPFKADYYNVVAFNNRALPTSYGGGLTLVSARLAIYAVGRTIDQRLVNDRTGRGTTGGNTRDTTVLRGQMMDVRVLRFESGKNSVTYRDSSVVDVEISDTVFVIRRPHPDPKRTQVDSGYLIGRLMVVPTVVSLAFLSSQTTFPATLQYEITHDR